VSAPPLAGPPGPAGPTLAGIVDKIFLALAKAR
jgi:hypothetical protein